MKTSDKILIGILIVVFSPVIIVIVMLAYFFLTLWLNSKGYIDIHAKDRSNAQIQYLPTLKAYATEFAKEKYNDPNPKVEVVYTEVETDCGGMPFCTKAYFSYMIFKYEKTYIRCYNYTEDACSETTYNSKNN